MAIAPRFEPEPLCGSAASRAGDPLALRDGTQLWLRDADSEGASLFAGDERAALVAVDDQGRIAGRAAYARVYGPRAVLDLEVGGGFSHSELPEVLISSLCLRAAQHGIAVLLARVPASDVRLLAVLREDFHARLARDGHHVEVELQTAGPARWTSTR